ncbi:Ca(2+)-dependent cysteine protease [Phlyctochytrium bullatum]|nr:Ca(2+)-dependent cysteine protease [Phlyctochytrium bullatum]
MFGKLTASLQNIAGEKLQEFVQQQIPGQHGGGQQQQQQQQHDVVQNYTHKVQQYSGQGKRRALFIGINYVGQNGELRGCHQDVKNMTAFVDQRMPGCEKLILTDEPGVSADKLPTKQNIINGFLWLVSNAAPGDHFFVHYSGHGGSVKDNNGDEEDGNDETIYPLDHEKAGQIRDDEIHQYLCKPLPEGSQLTAVFDSCHSGSVLDLPFSYVLDGGNNVVEIDNRVAAAKAFLKGGQAWMKGDKQGAMSAAMEGVSFLWKEYGQKGGNNSAPAQSHGGQAGLTGRENDKVTRGVVIQWSGCMDSQTSADAHIEGRASGAMSWAFMKAMNESSSPTYVDLLRRVRELLREGKYAQVPQLSCGARTDLNVPFTFWMVAADKERGLASGPGFILREALIEAACRCIELPYTSTLVPPPATGGTSGGLFSSKQGSGLGTTSRPGSAGSPFPTPASVNHGTLGLLPAVSSAASSHVFHPSPIQLEALSSIRNLSHLEYRYASLQFNLKMHPASSKPTGSAGSPGPASLFFRMGSISGASSSSAAAGLAASRSSSGASLFAGPGASAGGTTSATAKQVSSPLGSVMQSPTRKVSKNFEKVHNVYLGDAYASLLQIVGKSLVPFEERVGSTAEEDERSERSGKEGSEMEGTEKGVVEVLQAVVEVCRARLCLLDIYYYLSQPLFLDSPWLLVQLNDIQSGLSRLSCLPMLEEIITLEIDALRCIFLADVATSRYDLRDACLNVYKARGYIKALEKPNPSHAPSTSIRFFHPADKPFPPPTPSPSIHPSPLSFTSATTPHAKPPPAPAHGGVSTTPPHHPAGLQSPALHHILHSPSHHHPHHHPHPPVRRADSGASARVGSTPGTPLSTTASPLPGHAAPVPMPAAVAAAAAAAASTATSSPATPTVAPGAVFTATAAGGSGPKSPPVPAAVSVPASPFATPAALAAGVGLAVGAVAAPPASGCGVLRAWLGAFCGAMAGKLGSYFWKALAAGGGTEGAERLDRVDAVNVIANYAQQNRASTVSLMYLVSDQSPFFPLGYQCAGMSSYERPTGIHSYPSILTYPDVPLMEHWPNVICILQTSSALHAPLFVRPSLPSLEASSTPEARASRASRARRGAEGDASSVVGDNSVRGEDDDDGAASVASTATATAGPRRRGSAMSVSGRQQPRPPSSMSFEVVDGEEAVLGRRAQSPAPSVESSVASSSVYPESLATAATGTSVGSRPATGEEGGGAATGGVMTVSGFLGKFVGGMFGRRTPTAGVGRTSAGRGAVPSSTSARRRGKSGSSSGKPVEAPTLPACYTPAWVTSRSVQFYDAKVETTYTLSRADSNLVIAIVTRGRRGAGSASSSAGGGSTPTVSVQSLPAKAEAVGGATPSGTAVGNTPSSLSISTLSLVGGSGTGNGANQSSTSATTPAVGGAGGEGGAGTPQAAGLWSSSASSATTAGTPGTPVPSAPQATSGFVALDPATVEFLARLHGVMGAWGVRRQLVTGFLGTGSGASGSGVDKVMSLGAVGGGGGD